MLYDRWNVEDIDKDAVKLLFKQAAIPFFPALMLCARGIKDPGDAKEFLTGGSFSDPFLFPGMSKAVERIERAIFQNEKIAIYGDYDVDGVTASVILYKYLKSRNAQCEIYIPLRSSEGYGVNADAVRKLAAAGVTLIITVDTGITAIEETETAKSLNIDVIITDHHDCRDVLPDALAVINPKTQDSCYPSKTLAGVGVSFTLIRALCGNDEETFELYGDLLTLGTIADAVPITGENRYIVREGLVKVLQTKNKGLRALIDESIQANEVLTSQSVAYRLAPRINAAGRLGSAEIASELFITEDQNEAESGAKVLCGLNTRRQSIENEIYNEAAERIIPEKISGAIILDDGKWNPGVVGIVEARLAEKYSCPVFIICTENGIGRGSARSVDGVNLSKVLSEVSDLLITYGGHERAAGFSLAEENISAFRKAVKAICAPLLQLREKTLNVDAMLEPSWITTRAVKGLSAAEPFGSGNEKPVFALGGVYIKDLTPVGNGKHSRMSVETPEGKFNAVWFVRNTQEIGVYLNKPVDAAFNIEINRFNGRETVQLMLIDIREGGGVG